MSESRSEGQPEGSGQPSNNSGQPSNTSGQPSNSSGQPRTTGQPKTGGNGQTGGGRGPSRPSDPVADFQRWLMKAGARGMANQVADQVKRTIGSERRD